jgi:hypothetical protein
MRGNLNTTPNPHTSRPGEHPAVGVWFRWLRVLARRKREIARRTRSAPSGRPFGRRALFRVGYNLLMNVTCAECGCVGDRGVIIEACEKYPRCCCESLRTREVQES